MRQFITNFLIEITDTHSKIKISDSEAKEREKSLKNNKYRIKFDKEYSVNYLPEGYYAVEEIRNSTLLGVNFENNNGDQIIFQQHLDYTVANADSEGAKTEYIKIGEHKEFYIPKESIKLLYGSQKNIFWK